MGDADSSKEPVKPPIEDGKEQNQKPANGVYIYLAAIVLIVILARFPIPADWVGMTTSEEKSQVATEEVNGKGTKTTTTIKTEPAKTLWDWMSLLLAPATLAGLGFAFQSSQEKAKAAREEVEKRAEEAAKERANEQAQAEKERAEDRQRDDALEAYINSISDLLVGKSLSILAKQKARGLLTNTDRDLLDAGMNVIRARTLSIFRRFTDYKDSKRTDGDRKGSVLLFLYETGLITNMKEDEQGQEDTEPKQFQALLSLKSVYLTHAYLRGTNLRGADLSHAYLLNADICYADLRGASLTHALLARALFGHTDLSGADLSHANLGGAISDSANLRRADLNCAQFMSAQLISADFRGANLSGADLRFAKLQDADLTDANLISVDLEDAKLSRAILLRVDLSSLRPGIVRPSTLTQEQLEGEDPPLLCKVKLPYGIEVDPNRDCKNLPKVLLERYPEEFKTLEEAQAYVDEQPMP